MKLITVSFLVFLFFLPHCVFLEKQSDRKSSEKTKLEKNKFKATPKKTQTKAKLHFSERGGSHTSKPSWKHRGENLQNSLTSRNKKPSRPVKTISKKRLLAKEDVLPKNYYKAKKSKKELKEEFEEHLENLKQACETTENKKKLLKKQLDSFEDFLKTSLKDPNMDYTLQLLFSNIISALEETNYDNFIDLDVFTRFYRMLYNLPEDLEIKDYPDNWAQTIAKSIECIQQEEKKN
ncbi:MAG: hypothetical protein OXJ52_06650 [Oligoflexia bacterium]|nr:hypothetical protein [Oligoflexia bacterium]